MLFVSSFEWIKSKFFLSLPDSIKLNHNCNAKFNIDTNLYDSGELKTNGW